MDSRDDVSLAHQALESPAAQTTLLLLFLLLATAKASVKVDELGISSFVYKSSRPFNEFRLLTEVMDCWPVPARETFNIRDYLYSFETGGVSDMDSPFASVIRSKGFVTLEKYPNKEIFWSHAGRHFQLDILPEGAVDEEPSEPDSNEVVFIGKLPL